MTVGSLIETLQKYHPADAEVVWESDGPSKNQHVQECTVAWMPSATDENAGVVVIIPMRKGHRRVVPGGGIDMEPGKVGERFVPGLSK